MKFPLPPLSARATGVFTVGLATLSFWLVVLTYPSFYIFNPFETAIPTFRFEQIFSVSGSILYAIFPLLFACVPKLNGKSTKVAYIISASLWPLAILVIQTTIAVQGGQFYSYTVREPIFALHDLLAPIVLIALANTLFEPKTKN